MFEKVRIIKSWAIFSSIVNEERTESTQLICPGAGVVLTFGIESFENPETEIKKYKIVKIVALNITIIFHLIYR